MPPFTGCTVGSAQVPNRASNPADPSLCCNAALDPTGWSPRFLDGGIYGGAGYGKAVVRDFDGDGLADVASTDYTKNEVIVLLNRGGSLVPGGVYLVGADDAEIVAVDLNLDGFVDLVTANVSDETLSVLVGHGDGTFAPAVAYPACASASIRAGDFNGDTVPDVVCDCGVFLAGIGDGGFLPATPLSSSAITPISGDYVTTDDFNGDGKLDLAMDGFFTGLATLALGIGDGTFSFAGNATPTGPYPFDLISGDFDEDGLVDLAVQSATYVSDAPWKDEGVAFLKGLGDGGFSPAIWVPNGDGTPGRLVVADLAGDGKQELIVVNADSSIGQLTFGDAGLSIAPLVYGNSMYWPSIGDFNGDHAQDLAVTIISNAGGGQQIAVYVNGCP